MSNTIKIDEVEYTKLQIENQVLKKLVVDIFQGDTIEIDVSPNSITVGEITISYASVGGDEVGILNQIRHDFEPYINADTCKDCGCKYEHPIVQLDLTPVGVLSKELYDKWNSLSESK